MQQSQITEIGSASFKVKLTKEQRERIKRLIVDSENIMRACVFTDFNSRTFHRALTGHLIKNTQRDKLLAFCDMIEGKNQAA